MALFTPIKIGDITLSHRIVLAPMNRLRADDAHIPIIPIVKTHYVQRASTPGTLLISESVILSPQMGGVAHSSGIWNLEQIAAWKDIVDGVHAAGGFIFLQLAGFGRAAKDGFMSKAPSPIRLSSRTDSIPEELTVQEIRDFVKIFASAAYDGVYKANFDGVENGFLLDQFLQDVSNIRTDEYGGSIENRARFPIEVIAAVVAAVGASKVGLRLSPWSDYQDMRMKEPIPQFTYLIRQVKERYPDFAYLHMIEPRVSGAADRDVDAVNGESNDVFRMLWKPKPFISTGGFHRKDAMDMAENSINGLVAFGRYFTSNPDLVHRLKEDIPFTPYDRSTFYLGGDASGRGYTDFPFANV